MFKVAILGCPNVGKSTLFNRLLRSYQSVVYDRPGVTRDYNEGLCKFNQTKQAILIDSPGWGHKDEFSSLTQQKIVHITNIVNLIILVVEPDLNQQDRMFSLWLRKNSNVPIILAVNKCEKGSNSNAYELGWQNIVNISATQCIGLSGLRNIVATYIEEELQPITHEVLKISIVGRPNVGKSTLINQLMKESRLITSPISGTTRDAIAVQWQYQNYNITLVDTAGMRKQAKISEEIESSSVGTSIHSIRQAQVVVLILDAVRGLEHQDNSILNLIKQEEKPLVVAINKCDTIKNPSIVTQMKRYCDSKMLYETKTIDISALKNVRCNKVIDACIKIYETSHKQIRTGKLNNWLEKAIKWHQPPLSSRKTPIKLKFISQANNAPLTFKLIVNIAKDIDKSYIRYLISSLREEFDMHGVPIKIMLEKSHNPYIKKENTA